MIDYRCKSIQQIFIAPPFNSYFFRNPANGFNLLFAGSLNVLCPFSVVIINPVGKKRIQIEIKMFMRVDESGKGNGIVEMDTTSILLLIILRCGEDGLNTISFNHYSFYPVIHRDHPPDGKIFQNHLSFLK